MPPTRRIQEKLSPLGQRVVPGLGPHFLPASLFSFKFARPFGASQRPAERKCAPASGTVSLVGAGRRLTGPSAQAHIHVDPGLASAVWGHGRPGPWDHYQGGEGEGREKANFQLAELDAPTG